MLRYQCMNAKLESLDSLFISSSFISLSFLFQILLPSKPQYITCQIDCWNLLYWFDPCDMKAMIASFHCSLFFSSQTLSCRIRPSILNYFLGFIWCIHEVDLHKAPPCHVGCLDSLFLSILAQRTWHPRVRLKAVIWSVPYDGFLTDLCCIPTVNFPWLFDPSWWEVWGYSLICCSVITFMFSQCFVKFSHHCIFNWSGPLLAFVTLVWQFYISFFLAWLHILTLVILT